MASITLSRIFETSKPVRVRNCSHDPTTFIRASRASNTRLQHQRRPQTRPFFSTSRKTLLNTSRSRPVPLNQRYSVQQTTVSSRFSTSATRAATVVRQNPRVDDEGNEMAITISERAAKRLKQIVSSPPKKNTLTSTSSAAGASSDSHLRVTVTSGGCHGFQYLMSLEGRDKLDQEEDTVFEFDEDGRGSGEAKAEVVMDQASLELLKGSTVDFTQELIGSQFKIVGNPRATSSCGCGTSFDIE